MKTKSIWKELKTKRCQTLNRDLATEVLIVGGGITGLQTLHRLIEAGIDAVLVESNRCGEGVTSQSTAKITYLQNDTIPYIASVRGEAIAEQYILSQIYAMESLVELIEEEHIECSLKKVHSYIFAETKRGEKELEYLAGLLQRCDIPLGHHDIVPFKKTMTKAISVDDTFVFHPLEFTESLKEKYFDKIYENSKVEEITKEDEVFISAVNDRRIKSRYVVLANHYPYFLYPYFMPLKTHIEVSYLGAKRVAKTQDLSAINVDKPMISLRYHETKDEKYLIYLLNSFIASDIKDIRDNFEKLKNIHNFDYIWSNNDMMTKDRMPLIGPISKSEKRLLLASGFNTWGMTNSTIAGTIIRDHILGKENVFASLFDPKRGTPLATTINFPISISASAKAYIKSTKANADNNSITYTERDGQKVAIYKDHNGVEHVVLNKCPHLKCGLTLNEVELTWDCLCHGSRYTIDGKVIEGPSNEDITFKPKSE